METEKFDFNGTLLFDNAINMLSWKNMLIENLTTT